MAERKETKKPFKGVSISFILIPLWAQAKVDWPADMPDDMLEDAIMIARKCLDEHDFETEGVEVSTIRIRGLSNLKGRETFLWCP